MLSINKTWKNWQTDDGGKWQDFIPQEQEFTLWILTLGEKLGVQNRALMRQDWRHPRFWRKLGSQLWGQASMSSDICCCSNSRDQQAHASKYTKVTDLTQGFSGFLSRSRGCLLPCLKASQSLGLDQPPLTLFSWTAPAQFSAGCMFSIAATYHNFICLGVEMANNLHR